jgi:hypothetical protein
VSALKIANEFMDRICPAKRDMPGGEDMDLPRPETVTFIPLFVAGAEDTGARSRLSLHPVDLAVSSNTRHMIPTGDYQIHVYDTNIEALAAIRALEAIGLLEDLERFELPTGEGITLLRVGDAPDNGVEGLIVPTTSDAQQDASHRSLRFEGDGGDVCINVIDNRLDASMRQGPYAAKRAIYSSVSYPRAEVARIVHKEVPAQVDALHRGQLMSRLVELCSADLTALRICQRCLEEVPGALVSLGAVSAGHVIEQFEDMVEGLENEMLPPETKDIHDLVVTVAKEAGPNPDDVARDVAWSALHRNMTRPA